MAWSFFCKFLTILFLKTYNLVIYLKRKYDEREVKFQRARNLISSRQVDKPKLRQTQLAHEIKGPGRRAILPTNNNNSFRPTAKSAIKHSIPFDARPVSGGKRRKEI